MGFGFFIHTIFCGETSQSLQAMVVKYISSSPNEVVQNGPENRKKNHGNYPQDLFLIVFITLQNVNDHNNVNDEDQ